MAKIEFNVAIDNVTGALDSEHKLVCRRKHIRDTNGIVVYTCKPEAYMVQNKRDYTYKPPKGAELAHLQRFGNAAKQTTALLHAYKFPNTATPEQLELIEQFRRRFQAQINGPADLQAPLDSEGHPKHYYRFDNFVRAMIYQELKN